MFFVWFRLQLARKWAAWAFRQYINRSTPCGRACHLLCSLGIPVISAFNDLGPGDLGRPLVISPGDLARCAVIAKGDSWTKRSGIPTICMAVNALRGRRAGRQHPSFFPPILGRGSRCRLSSLPVEKTRWITREGCGVPR